MPPASSTARPSGPVLPTPPAVDETQLVVSLDVEEDEWGVHPAARGVTNVAALPALARRLAALGVKPTFFVSYVVAASQRAMAQVQEAAAISGGEIAAHLHPWNTPPNDPVEWAAVPALARHPETLQRAKVAALTAALERATGVTPRAFRAGKLSFGLATARIIASTGYLVDSSVSVFWTPDDEPVLVPLPADAWRGAFAIAAGTRTLLEVPLTSGFSRAPFARWAPVARLMDSPAGRRLRLAGVASRSGLLRRVVLSPELDALPDLLVLWRRLREQRARVVQLTWHSPSLVPGRTPYAHDTADVRALLDTVERFVEHALAEPGVRASTITDAAHAATGATRSVAPATVGA